MTINRKPLIAAPKSLGERIRFYRMHKSITQRKLATRMGVSRWRLHQIESEAIVPTQEEIRAIDVALGIDRLDEQGGGQQ